MSSIGWGGMERGVGVGVGEVQEEGLQVTQGLVDNARALNFILSVETSDSPVSLNV